MIWFIISSRPRGGNKRTGSDFGFLAVAAQQARSHATASCVILTDSKPHQIAQFFPARLFTAASQQGTDRTYGMKAQT